MTIENKRRKYAIAYNIKQFRKQLGIKQYELADMLNVAPSTVSSWEQCLSTPDIDTLYDLCKVFNVEIEEISTLPHFMNSEQKTNELNTNSKPLDEDIHNYLEKEKEKRKKINFKKKDNNINQSSRVAEKGVEYKVNKRNEDGRGKSTNSDEEENKKINYMLDLSPIEKRIVLAYRKGEQLDKQLIERVCKIK